MLFRKKPEPKSGLQQPEREAIIDLLHLCLYADSHIAVKESQFLTDVVDSMGWETQSSFSSYEQTSIAAARAARQSTEATQRFLASAASRLKSKPSRDLAVDFCKQLFAADGQTVDKEAALLDQIRAALK